MVPRVAEGDPPHDSDSWQELREHWRDLNSFLLDWGTRQDVLLHSFVRGGPAARSLYASHQAPTGSSTDLEPAAPCGLAYAASATGSSTDIEGPVAVDPNAVSFALVEEGGGPGGVFAEQSVSFAEEALEQQEAPHSAVTSTGEKSEAPHSVRSWPSPPRTSPSIHALQNISPMRDAQRQKLLQTLKSGSFSSDGVQDARHAELIRLSRRRIFTQITGVVIFANAIIIAAQVDFDAREPGNNSVVFEYLELPFSIYYVVEITLKIMLQRMVFFRSLEWSWNLFDLALAAQAMYEMTVFFAGREGFQNLSFLRVIRLLKMLKLLRLVRLLREFRELRLILSSFFHCVKSLAWAVILVISVTFVFGIFILQLCNEYVMEGHTENMDALEKYWSSVLRSMMSLFMSTMGGQDWILIVQPLESVGYHAYSIFIVYVIVFTYGVVNIINAIFLEAMMQHAQTDSKMLMQVELERSQEYIRSLQCLYDSLDDDGNGDVSFEEFERHLHKPEMVAFLSSLQLDATDATHFFGVLSHGGKWTVDINTFVTGCIKLKGQARSMDLIGFISHYKNAWKEHAGFHQDVREMLVRIAESLDALDAVSAARSTKGPRLSAHSTSLGVGAFDRPPRDRTSGVHDQLLPAATWSPPLLHGLSRYCPANARPSVALQAGAEDFASTRDEHQGEATLTLPRSAASTAHRLGRGNSKTSL